MTDEPTGDASAPHTPMTRAERIFVRISILQTILAVAGLFTGGVALYAALNEADAVRKQQQATVWPYVRVTPINYGIAGEERFDISVGNRGIGPARIEYASIAIDGEKYNSWFDILNGLADGEKFGISNFTLAQQVLAPNEDITAISIQAEHAPKSLVFAFRDLMRSGRASMQICYCSVFDDCWMLEAATGDRNEVDACPAPDPDSAI